jgi:hypothetical protein
MKSQAAAISTPEPTTDAVHQRDARHRQRLERRVRRERPHASLAHPRLILPLALLHVRAGAEGRAVAPHEHHPDIFRNLPGDAKQRVAHVEVERVAHLGAVENDAGDAPGERVLDGHIAFAVLNPEIS